MPRREIYRRGKYWLDYNRDGSGAPLSPNLFIWRYDAAARRIRGTSTRTSETAAAIVELDRVYLADAGEAAAYCPTCGRPAPSAAAYLLADAIADYRLEIGDNRTSASSIAARLGNVLDYLEAIARPDMSCAEIGGHIEPLRVWLAAKPVEWRNKAGAVTASRQRSPAAVEEAVHQLRAALSHAHAKGRIEAAPSFKGRARKIVSPVRTSRADLPTIARILQYAADPLGPRRRPLHAFVVASLCTLARPDAIFDISTRADRRQVQGDLLALNPLGRPQTRKFRPLVPIVPALAVWLEATAADPAAKHWLVEHGGEPIRDVKTSWRNMLAALELPADRDWQPYILRHSLATLLRDRGASAWDLEGQLGHRTAGTSEIYAVSSLFSTAQTALASVLEELETLAPGALAPRLRRETKKAAS